jgi:hypothetical protein
MNLACGESLMVRNRLGNQMGSDLLAGHQYTMLVTGGTAHNTEIIGAAKKYLKSQLLLSIMGIHTPKLLMHVLHKRARHIIALAERTSTPAIAIVGFDNKSDRQHQLSMASATATTTLPSLSSPQDIQVYIDCLETHLYEADGTPSDLRAMSAGHEFCLFIGGTPDQSDYITMMVMESIMAL